MGLHQEDKYETGYTPAKWGGVFQKRRARIRNYPVAMWPDTMRKYSIQFFPVYPLGRGRGPILTLSYTNGSGHDGVYVAPATPPICSGSWDRVGRRVPFRNRQYERNVRIFRGLL